MGKNNQKYYYIAQRGEERFIGEINEVAAKIGKSPHYVHKLAYKGFTTKSGWKIEKYGKQICEYIAERDGDDPIEGSAEEIACLLGLSIGYVFILIKTGKSTQNGWRVHCSGRNELTVNSSVHH